MGYPVKALFLHKEDIKKDVIKNNWHWAFKMVF